MLDFQMLVGPIIVEHEHNLSSIGIINNSAGFCVNLTDCILKMSWSLPVIKMDRSFGWYLWFGGCSSWREWDSLRSTDQWMVSNRWKLKSYWKERKHPVSNVRWNTEELTTLIIPLTLQFKQRCLDSIRTLIACGAPKSFVQNKLSLADLV